MSNDHEPSTVARLYGEAYALQYSEHELLRAILAYEVIITSHPDTREAEHSRVQIRNIANLVVPAHELLSAQTELALRYLRNDGHLR